MNVTIKKASIRGSLFLSYEFEQNDGGITNNIKTNCDAAIHDDLRLKFKELTPHFVLICEQVTDEKLIKKAIENPEIYLHDRELAPDQTLFNYRVSEFSIFEKKGFQLLSISGAKALQNGNEIYFQTPPIDLDSSDYKFIKELNKTVDELKQEVVFYMEGKQAEKLQIDMFTDSEEDENRATEKEEKSAFVE